MQEVELDNEQDKLTIAKLIKSESDLRRELENIKEENDRIEIEELLKNSEVEQTDALLECLDLMAELGMKGDEISTAQSVLQDRYMIDVESEHDYD